MQLIPLFIVAAISGLLVKGWIIPEGQPDGFYAVSTDESGNEIHVPIVISPNVNLIYIDLGDAQPIIPPAKFRKRQVGGLTEGCGAYPIDVTNISNAFNRLVTLCTENCWLQPGWDWYATSGSVAAYARNLSTTGV